jgi:hypothetical protein
MEWICDPFVFIIYCFWKVLRKPGLQSNQMIFDMLINSSIGCFHAVYLHRTLQMRKHVLTFPIWFSDPWSQTSQLVISYYYCYVSIELLAVLLKTVVVLTKLWPHENFIKLPTEVFFELVFNFDCFISKCQFSLFCLMLSPAKVLRCRTPWGCSSLLIIIHIKPRDKCNSSYLCKFGFYVQLLLLFPVSSLSGFLFVTLKNLCILFWFGKHHLLVSDTGL